MPDQIISQQTIKGKFDVNGDGKPDELLFEVIKNNAASKSDPKYNDTYYVKVSKINRNIFGKITSSYEVSSKEQLGEVKQMHTGVSNVIAYSFGADTPLGNPKKAKSFDGHEEEVTYRAQVFTPKEKESEPIVCQKDLKVHYKPHIRQNNTSNHTAEFDAYLKKISPAKAEALNITMDHEGLSREELQNKAPSRSANVDLDRDGSAEVVCVVKDFGGSDPKTHIGTEEIFIHYNLND